MSKEDGELVRRKMNYARLTNDNVCDELKISRLLLKMFLKGEVIQLKFNEELKALMIKRMKKKYGRVKKKKK